MKRQGAERQNVESTNKGPRCNARQQRGQGAHEGLFGSVLHFMASFVWICWPCWHPWESGTCQAPQAIHPTVHFRQTLPPTTSWHPSPPRRTLQAFPQVDTSGNATRPPFQAIYPAPCGAQSSPAECITPHVRAINVTGKMSTCVCKADRHTKQ